MNELLHNWGAHDGAIVFVVVLLEQAGLPIPAAPCLLAVGALCAKGEAAPLTVIALTIFASLIADCAWFLFGRRRGNTVLNLLDRTGLCNRRTIERVKPRFLHYGMLLLVISRFLPGLGLIVPPLAGTLQVGLGRFLLFDGLGSLLYSGLYLFLGIAFQEQVEAGLQTISQLGPWTLLLLPAFLIAYFLRKHASSKAGLRPAVTDKPEPQQLRQSASAC